MLKKCRAAGALSLARHCLVGRQAALCLLRRFRRRRRELRAPVVAFFFFFCRQILQISEITVFVWFMSRVFLVFLASISIPRIEENMNIIGNSIVTGREKSITHIREKVK